MTWEYNVIDASMGRNPWRERREPDEAGRCPGEHDWIDAYHEAVGNFQECARCGHDRIQP